MKDIQRRSVTKFELEDFVVAAGVEADSVRGDIATIDRLEAGAKADGGGISPTIQAEIDNIKRKMKLKIKRGSGILNAVGELMIGE